MAELTPERMKEIGESIDLLTVHAKEGDVPWSCYEAMLDLYHAVQAKDASIAKAQEVETKLKALVGQMAVDGHELYAEHEKLRGCSIAQELIIQGLKEKVAQLEPDAKLGRMVREMPQGNLFRDDLGLFGWREWDARENDRWSCSTPEQALGLEEPDPEEKEE